MPGRFPRFFFSRKQVLSCYTEPMSPRAIFLLLWLGWALSWFAASFWSAKTEKQVPTTEVWVYRGCITAGAVLLWHRTGELMGAQRLWYPTYNGAYALAGVTFLGILFAWWARIHLGRLWSGAVTRKEGHRVVDTGPYGIVRHPIYTGLGTATVATAAVVSTLPAIAGGGLILLGMYIKARLEERFLAAELGAGAYGAYRTHVPMLVPFLPAGNRR